jgi:hypothetical protein
LLYIQGFLSIVLFHACTLGVCQKAWEKVLFLFSHALLLCFWFCVGFPRCCYWLVPWFVIWEVGSLTCSSVPFSVWCDVFDFRCFFWFTCIRFLPKFLFFFFQVMKKVDQALVIYCMLWLLFFYFSGLYAQVLPNMLCNWLRLKENESRCHQNNLWTNHFVTLQVSPRLAKDRERFPPNNILFMLFGTGLLWMSWTCFNGGDPCVVSTDASLAVLNTVDWECFHYGLKQCFSHSQSTEKYQNVWIPIQGCRYCCKDRDHVNYVYCLGLINTFLMQCILCPPEMHQKTYITAYHVASNADNEQ